MAKRKASPNSNFQNGEKNLQRLPRRLVVFIKREYVLLPVRFPRSLLQSMVFSEVKTPEIWVPGTG